MLHEDWVPTLMAAAGEPNIKEKLKAGGVKAIGRDYKVHLDGYNILPLLMRETEKSPRKEVFYFSDMATWIRSGWWLTAFAVFSLALPTYAQSDGSSSPAAAETAVSDPAQQDFVAEAPAPSGSTDFFSDFWTRPNLSGNWGGIRDEWAESGFTVDLAVTHVTQSVVSGGNEKPGPLIARVIEDETGNGASVDMVLKLDTGKAGLWPGGFFKARGEARFGDSVTFRYRSRTNRRTK